MLFTNLKRYTKYIAFFILLLFLGSVSVGFFTFYRIIEKDRQDVVLLIEGKSIRKSKLSTIYDGYSSHWEKTLFLNEFLLSQVIDEMARSIHLGISSREVGDSRYDKTVLLRAKILQKVSESYRPSKSEIDNVFANLGIKSGEVDFGDNIEENLKRLNGPFYARHWLAQKFDKIDVKTLDSSLDSYLKKEALRLGSFSISNVSFCFQVKAILRGRRVYREDEKTVYKAVYEYLKGRLVLAAEAEKRGLKLSIDNLTPEDRVEKMVEALGQDIKKEISCDDVHVRAYFNSNSSNYIERERLYFDMVTVPIVPSQDDKIDSRKRAEEILKISLANNKLSLVDLTLSAQEFRKRFGVSTVKGKVYSKVLKDGNNLYIAKGEGKSVDLVEVKINISEKTREEAIQRSEETFKNIEDGSITIESLNSDELDFKNLGPIYPNSKNIPAKVLKRAFKTKDLDLFMVEDEEYIYICRKRIHVSGKSSFIEVKESVKKDYLNMKMNEELEKLREKLINSSSEVEIVDESIRSILN